MRGGIGRDMRGGAMRELGANFRVTSVRPGVQYCSSFCSFNMFIWFSMDLNL